MKPKQRLNLLKQAITGKTDNSASVSLARDFLRNGPMMMGDFSQTILKEQDKYTGYMYGAVTKVSNRVAMLAQYNLHTDAAKNVMDAAKEKREPVVHPYLEIIDRSTSFADGQFWREIQTYVMLKGVYYLFARRAKASNGLVGTVQEFKLLNPYDISRMLSQETMEVEYYVESRGGMQRVIEPHQIIEIRPLNPFSREDPFSVSDAAKDAQFTLRQANDQVRNTLRRNEKFPGVVMVNATDAALDEQQLKNLKARLTGKTQKDEPLFVDGQGGLDWKDMQVDLKKSLPVEVNEINLNALIAVTGVSRTKFGIEQSGVTRDTAEVQDDQFIADIAIPALETILNALNQDYKTNYPKEYQNKKYNMYIDSPLGVDKEAEAKDVEIREKSFQVYVELVNKGYERDLAARYVAGEVTLEELGKPTNEPVQPSLPASTAPTEDDDQNATEQAANGITHVHNALDLDRMTGPYANALRETVVDVQRQLVSSVVTKVTKNAYDSQSDIVEDSERNKAIEALIAAVTIYYLSTMPVIGNEVMRQRITEFAGLVLTATPQFVIDKEVRDYIAEVAQKSAKSHVNTILDDLLDAVRKSALDGVARDDLAAVIRREFNYISTTRADLIAQSETYRAFNRSQYDADREFLQSIGKTKQAYKKWRTRSDDPCPFCQALAAEPEVAFGEPFRELGDTVEADFTKADGSTTVRKMAIDYEVLESGNAHPRCYCTYDLIIKEV